MAGDRLTQKAVKALGVFGGTQVANIIFSVVRTKLIAIWIGPIGVALFAIYNTVIEMVSTTTQLSMRQTAVRDIAQASSSRLGALVTAVRWWGRRLGLLGAIIMLVASPLLSLASFGDTGHWWAFALLSLCMLCMAVAASEQALMQGMGRLKILARSLVAAPAIGTVLALPLLYYLRVKGIVPSLIVLYFMALLCSVMLNRSVKGQKQPSAESRALGRGFLRLGVSMTIATLAGTGMNYAFLSYLNQAAGEEMAGVYQAGYTLTVKYVELIFTALAMDYYPRLAAICSRRRVTSTFMSHQVSLLMCVLAPLVVVFVSAASLFLRILYSDGFMMALPMITIAIGGVVFRALSYCYSYLIVARGDGKAYVMTEVVSCVVGLTLNIVGFHYWGLAGVGVSYVIWYVIYAVMCREVCRRRYGVDITMRAWGIAASTIVIVALAIWLRQFGWWQPLALLPAAGMVIAYASRKR